MPCPILSHFFRRGRSTALSCEQRIQFIARFLSPLWFGVFHIDEIGDETMLTNVFVLAMAVALFAPDSVLDTAQQTEMVAPHNRWRKEIGVPAVSWSADLASKAQAWANHLKETRGCNQMHSGSAGVGENLYWASPKRWSSGKTEEQSISPADVVDSWAQERKDYTYRTNSCATGKVCGHYTQVVWRITTEVGCGKAVCSDKSQVWVCNYKPAGKFCWSKAVLRFCREMTRQALLTPSSIDFS